MTCKKSYLSMASFFIPFMRGGLYMDNENKWQDIRSQLSKNMKDLQPKEQFQINDLIMNKAQNIMQQASLSLIYDEYGNQLYEKTSDVQNYISCKKTGNTFLLYRDESKLIETKTKNDKSNTDFIAYDAIQDVHQDSVKWNMDIDSDFQEYNNKNLYIVQERNERKQKVFNDGIEAIKNYINIDGKKDFNKINKNFITFIK